MFTPTHKAQDGHDEPLNMNSFERTLQVFLSSKNITSVSAPDLSKLLVKKLGELFLRGEQMAAARELILVDTKYELGLTQSGELLLADEVHTPDSSRYWLALPQNGVLKQLSKEFLREELMAAEIIENDDLTAGGIEKLRFMANSMAERISERYGELEHIFLSKAKPSNSPLQRIPWPIPSNEFEEAIAPASRVQKLFIAGNGGRDFSIMNRFSSLPSLRQVWNWPGARAWKSRQVPVANLTSETFEAAINHAHQSLPGGIDLVIAGPEVPISQGIKSFCDKLKIPCLAPGPKGAALEASKLICKQALIEAGIPTAEYQTLPFSKLIELKSPSRLPCVLKYDGLAAGKGVFIIQSNEDWANALEEIHKQYKVWQSDVKALKCDSANLAAGEPVFLLENLIQGEEFSIFALCNGTSFRLLPVARDYKRRNNFQKGPNTGGMGSVAPVHIEDGLLKQFKDAFERILAYQLTKGEPYTGFLFGGFMVTPSGKAYVLEFNSRLGDPETQVILPGLKDDFLLECYRTAAGLPLFWPEKSGSFFEHDGLSRVYLVGASPEYPDKSAPYRKLRRRDREDIVPLNSNVTFVPSSLEADGRTKGGRAFGLLAKAQTIGEARKQVYNEMEEYILEDIRPHFRTDIAQEWEE